MARTIGLGIQDFKKIVENHYFYIDKTMFIKQWWESGDDVTLITRPRRFGKTLALSMLDYFFSVKYKQEQEARRWYDGFIFGDCKNIYNPWSVLNYLREKKLAAYWVHTSSNQLIGKLIREGSADVKIVMEDLLHGRAFYTQLDEQIVFDQLDYKTSAVWSLLLASGYLRVQQAVTDPESGKQTYELYLTNMEVRLMFVQMIEGWFKEYTPAYNAFIKALLCHDIDAMNEYMNCVSEEIFSSFDTGTSPSKKLQPERFYHGFVLGLTVELSKRYVITSNRESGFGRYDIMLTPKKEGDDAYIIEFKVFHPKKERSLADTVKTALAQIEAKKYDAELIKKGIPPARIYKYGFAFKASISKSAPCNMAFDLPIRKGCDYEKTTDYFNRPYRSRKNRTVAASGKAGKRRHYLRGVHAGVQIYGHWHRQNFRSKKAGRSALFN